MPRRALTICAATICLVAVLSPAGDLDGDDRRPVVAVADFRCVGSVGVRDGGKAAAELLRSALDRRLFRLVERSDLAAVLSEQDLVTGQVVTGRAHRPDKLKGIQYVIVGSIVNVGKLCVVARMVDVSSGEVVRTAQASSADIGGLHAAVAQVARALGVPTGQEIPQEGGARGEIRSRIPATVASTTVQTTAVRSAPAAGAHLSPRVRCLWAEIRMLQRCLGETELFVIADTDRSAGELALLLVDLKAEKARLTARISAGQAVVVTTPVTTEPPPARIRTIREPRERVTVSKPRRYRRSARPKVSMAPLRMAFGNSRRARATVRRKR